MRSMPNSLFIAIAATKLTFSVHVHGPFCGKSDSDSRCTWRDLSLHHDISLKILGHLAFAILVHKELNFTFLFLSRLASENTLVIGRLVVPNQMPVVDAEIAMYTAVMHWSRIAIFYAISVLVIDGWFSFRWIIEISLSWRLLFCTSFNRCSFIIHANTLSIPQEEEYGVDTGVKH